MDSFPQSCGPQTATPSWAQFATAGFELGFLGSVQLDDLARLGFFALDVSIWFDICLLGSLGLDLGLMGLAWLASLQDFDFVWQRCERILIFGQRFDRILTFWTAF